MAETEAKETVATPEAAPAKKKGKMVPMLMIGGLMAVQGVGVYFVTKMFVGAPAAATAEEGHGEAPPSGDHEPASTGHGESAPSGHGGGEKLVEIELADCRPNNKVSGKLVTFHVRLSILAKGTSQAKAEESIKGARARIDDAVNFIFRSAEPRHINEPGLETVKRRVRKELDRIFSEEGLVEEVLITQFLQSGSGL